MTYRSLGHFSFYNCSFSLRDENICGTRCLRQSITSRNFKTMTEGLRSFLLEFRYGQKILNTLNRRG